MTVNFKNLVVQMLPTFMRQPKIYSFVYCLVYPLVAVQYNAAKNKKRNISTINQTGQVCRLRGLLNDLFDPSIVDDSGTVTAQNRRIRIKNGTISDWTFVWKKATFSWISNPRGEALMVGQADSITPSTGKLTDTFLTGNTAVTLISKQGDVGSVGYDFIVSIPLALKPSTLSVQTMFESQVISVVNANKLASKRYEILYE